MTRSGFSVLQGATRSARAGAVMCRQRPTTGILRGAAQTTSPLLLLLLVMVFTSSAAYSQIWSAPPAITPGSITNPSADIIIGIDTLPFYLTTSAAADTDTMWQMSPPTYPPDSFNNTGAYTCDTQGVGTLSSPYGTSVLWTPPTTGAKFTLKCTYNDDAPPVLPPATGTRNDDPVYATRTVTVVQANVFADTYYNAFAYGGDDDPNEENLPGRLLALNEDSTTPGYHPHWVGTNGVPEEKYLTQLGLNYLPTSGVDGCKIKLEVSSGGGSIRIWKRSVPIGSCDGELVSPSTWVIGTDTVPAPMFMEGVSPGYVTIYAVFLRPDNSEAHRDALLVQVVDIFDISSNNVYIKKGIGLDVVNELRPAGTTTSLNVSHIPVENLQYRMTVPQPPTGVTYSLFNPSTEAVSTTTLAFPNPSSEQIFTGIFAVNADFNTGTVDVPVRVYAGTTDSSGNVRQGFVAERKLHAVVSAVNVSDPGNTDGTLDLSDGNGPFHRVKMYSSTYYLNGMDCTLYLPPTNPATCNIVNDLLSLDSAYVYIRGTSGTCNIEVGFQLGHTNNPGWKRYALVNGEKRTLTAADPNPPDYHGPGLVEISYRTTGNVQQTVPSKQISFWIDGHEYYLTEDTWSGNVYKGVTRVTSIGQDTTKTGMPKNGPLDSRLTPQRGLFTSGSQINGVSWTGNLLYVDNNTGIAWTRSNFPDTYLGNYPCSPYVNASTDAG